MKSSKSKTDLISNFLVQKNFIKNELKYRKSDNKMTAIQPTEYLMDTIIKSEISRVNSFTFSNIFGLTGNPVLVDQQFMKFLTFVNESQDHYRSDLEKLVPPLLCHIHIEILKGKEGRKIAYDFLKKYSTILGLVDQNNYNKDAEEEKNFLTTLSVDTRNTFSELIRELLLIQRYQDIEFNSLIVNFRCCKYQTKISIKCLKLLKKFLTNNGHVFILQTLQTWIHIHPLFEESDDDMSKDELLDANFYDEKSDTNYFGNQVMDDLPFVKFENDSTEKSYNPNVNNKYQNSKLYELEESFKKFNTTYQYPVKVFNLCNSEWSLSSVSNCKQYCHLAFGFEDSKIVLWSLGSSNYGRKPYRLFDDCLCKWSINNCKRSIIDDMSDYSSDEEFESAPNESQIYDNENEPQDKSKKVKLSNKFKCKVSLREQWQDYTFKSSAENNFTNSSIILHGHRKAVTDLMFSEKNDILLSVSRDTTLRVWNAESYKCSSVYSGHNYPIWCVSESSNGNYVATGSKDNTARLWSYDRKFPVKTFIGHTQDVDCIDFHPNGNYIATGSTDTTIRLWCITSGKVLRIFTECHLPVNSIKFSPDGKYLAAGGDETKIRIFDLAGGQQLMDLKKNNASPTKCLSWSADSKKLISGCVDGSYFVWKINAHESSSTNNSSTSVSNKSKTGSTNNDKRSASSSSNLKVKPYSLLQSNYITGCKRLLKVTFDSTNTFLNCIGNDNN